MGMCLGCSEVFPSDIMVNKYCPNCLEKAMKELKNEELKNIKLEELKKNKEILDSIILSTETFISEPIVERIGITSVQCVYGLNLVKDFFIQIRNVVGGRVKTIEDALSDANLYINEELKIKAYLEGGNAVIGIKIEHTFNNANDGSILSVFATGTIIKI